jgi:hypothetical protein
MNLLKYLAVVLFCEIIKVNLAVELKPKTKFV